jgi:hypothetical protein
MTLFPNWRVDLMRAHDRLFDIMISPRGSRGYPLCDDGWRDVIERLCGRIESALQENDAFRFDRVGRSSASCGSTGAARSRKKPGVA